MAENVEERIVAAKFDSSDFEKGVDKTVKKLDELKQSLNLKDSGKSIAELGEKTTKATESMNESIEKLSERFTTFVGQVKQKLISGFADQVVNTFFRMEQAALNFAKSMTFDQISAGLQKYEDALTAVRMMTLATYKDKNGNIVKYTEEQVYAAIGALQTYADETSYSMSQMTDAMSKMVAAGVGMDQATKNVQGIASACAAAGVNATDAARAFFNLSQAYSSGGLKYTDYRSLELLNMTNEAFQNQLLEAGVRAGTLKKTGDGTYKTQKSKTNGKVTAGKTVTRKSLTESLRYNWASTEVMDELFGGSYYIDVDDFMKAKEDPKTGRQRTTQERIDYLTSLYDTEKLKKTVEKLKADDPIRKAYEDLKNDDAKKTFLEQLGHDANELNKISKKYDGIDPKRFTQWINSLADDDERKKHYKALKTQKERQAYMKELEKDAGVLKAVGKKFKGIDTKAMQNYIEGLEDDNVLKQNYKALKTAEQKKKYLEQLAKQSEELGKNSKKYSEVAAAAFLAAREARNFKDVINAIGDYVSSKWSKAFENLFGGLEKAAELFTHLSEGGIAEFFTGLADKVADTAEAFNASGKGVDTFHEIIKNLDAALGNFLGIFYDVIPEADDLGISLFNLMINFREATATLEMYMVKLREWFNMAGKDEEMTRIEKIRKIMGNLSASFSIVGRVIGIATHAIAKAWNLLSPIFDAILTALVKITQPIDDLSKDKKPFDDLTHAVDNVFIALQPLMDLLAPIIKGIGDIGGAIGEFFLSGAISTVTMNVELFADALGLLLEILGLDSAQAKDGLSVMQKITNSVNELVAGCKEGINAVKEFFDNLFKDIRQLLGLKVEDDGTGDQNGGAFSRVQNFLNTNEFVQKAKGWLKQAQTDIEQFIKDLPTKAAEFVQKVSKAVNDFFTKLFYTEVDDQELNLKRTGSVQGPFKKRVETPLKKWLDTAVETTSKFIAELPGNIIAGIGKAFDLFGILIDTIFGDGTKVDTKGDKDKEATKDAASAVREWGQKFIAALQTELKALPGKIGALFTKIKKKIVSAFLKIKDWFSKSEAIATIKSWGVEIVNSIKEVIEGIPAAVKSFFSGTDARKKEIQRLLLSQSLGDNERSALEKELAALNERITFGGILDSLKSIGESIFNTIIGWFSGSDDIEDNCAWFAENVIGYLRSIPSRIWKRAKEIASDIGEVWTYIIQNLTGNADENPELQQSNASFAERFPNLSRWLDSAIEWIKGIPDTLSEVWDKTKDDITKFFGDLSNYWRNLDEINELRTLQKEALAAGNEDDASGYGAMIESLENDNEEFESQFPAITNFVKNAKEWITNIPKTLSKTWEETKSKVVAFFSGFAKYWRNLNEINELRALQEEARAAGNEDDVSGYGAMIESLENDNKEFEDKFPAITNFVKNAREWIENIYTNLDKAWTKAQGDINEFWNGFKAYWNQTLGKEQTNEEKATAEAFAQKHPEISNFISSAVSWIISIPGTLKTTWDEWSGEVTEFWNGFKAYWNQTLGKEQINEEKATAEAFAQKYPALTNFVTGAVAWISSIPGILINAWNTTQSSISKFFIDLSNYWDRLNVISKLKATIADKNASEADKLKAQNGLNLLKELPTTFETENPVMASMLGGIHGFVDGLSGEFNKLIETISLDFSSFWEDVKRVFNGEELPDLKEGATLGERFRRALTNFFGNIPNDMISGIKNSVGTIKGAIESVTVAINDALSSNGDVDAALTELSEESGKKVSEATKEGLANAEEGAGESTASSNAFLQSIIDLGQTIYDLITKTIPDFVVKGFTYLINEWNKPETGWKAQLKTWFSGLTGIKEEDLNLDTFKNKLVEWIKGIPSALSSAFDWVKEKISGIFSSKKKIVPENIARVLSSNTLPASGQNSILDYFENLGYDISRWRKTTTLFDNISEIGKSIQEAVGGIFDGISLDSIASFLGTLAGKIAANFPKFISDIVSSFMTTYNEESEKIAKETATENPFSETGSLLEKLTGWFGGLFEAISGVLDVFMEKDENGKSTGHLSTFGKVVLGIIGAIALVHIVADTINTFRHPIASADNNFQEDKKDGLFGVIKALINFLTITSVLALVASQLDEDGMKKVREVFDIIADILDRIMPLLWTSVALKYGPDALNSIGGFIDMIAGWFGKGKKTVISFDSAGMEDMAENMTKATESVKQMAASSQEAQKALHGNNNTGVLNMDGFIGNLLGALGIGAKGLAIVGVADAAGLAVNDFLSDLLGNANMFGSTINGIYDAIKGSVTDISEKITTVESAKTVITKVLELGGQIVELGAMRTSVQEGNGVIDSIATSLMLLTSQFTEKLYIDEFNTGLQNLMGMKDDMVTFTEFVTDNGSTFDDFKLAIASLGAALSFFDIGNVSNISSMDDEWVDHAAHILSRLLSNQELFSVIDMITPENIGTDSASVAKGMETLMLFATGISNLAKGLSGFTDETGDNLISLFNTLDKLSENGDSAEVGSELSKHFLSLGKGLQEFTESVSTLEVNDDKLKHAFAIIHQVSDLASRLDEVGNSWFMKVLIGGTSIQEFGVQLATLGGNMASFISAIKPIKLDGEDAVSDWNFDNVAIAMFGLERVADAAQKLTWTNIDKVKQLLKPDVDGKYLGDYIAEFFTQLVGAKVNLGKDLGNNVPIGFAGIPFDILNNYLDSFSKFAEGLANLSSVTSDILTTLGSVTQKHGDETKNVYLLYEIGRAIASMFSKITVEMQYVRENGDKGIDLDLVNSVFDVFKKFTDSISTLYTYINNVYGSYKEGFGISAIGTPTDFLNSISSSIDTITGEADHLFAMIDKLATYTNDANVTRALRIFDIIKSIGVSLAVFSGSMFAQGTLEPLDFISNGIQELQGFGASSTLFLDALGSILTNIDTFFEDEQNVATLEKIGRMMARHIFNGINAAFNNPFEQMQPVITPVLNDEALAAIKQKVDETFGTSDMNVMFGATITESIRDAFSGINPETKEPYNYFMDLNEIKSDIKDLNKSIGELEDAMSHMKLVMDTGVVAGEVAPYVDRYIGKAGNIYWNRHVTGGVYELEQ